MDHLMRSPRLRALRQVLLFHEGTLVLLVALTGALGGLWAHFWQQSSQESLRINSLLIGALQIRGDLYRELKEISRARLSQDPTALDQYWAYLYRIDRLFYSLQRHAGSEPERASVRDMRQAYELMQAEMNQILAEPFQVSDAVRARIIDPTYETRMLGDFEQAFDRFSQLMAQRQGQLESQLHYWQMRAPLLTLLPILLAAALLAYSHRILKHEFFKPMTGILAGARRFSEGDLDPPISEDGVAEVRALAHSINQMARDLAESRDALIRSERQAALGALVPVVAHNIRNPLASIRATAQVVDRDSAPEDWMEARRDIIDSVDRLERWVGALLSYLNPLHLHRNRITAGRLLDGALAPLKNALSQSEVALIRRDRCQNHWVEIDVDLMEQALHGLLQNALEASPPGGRITIDCTAAHGHLTLTIDDEGPGMPARPQPADLRPGPTTKRTGTGLGIPFAAKIVEAHGGGLVFAATPSGGARVGIRLPLAAAGDPRP